MFVKTFAYVLNRLLERPIDSMGRARLLDKKSSKWAGPIYSTKNRVNGNEAHLLDERLGFRPAGSLDDLSSKWDGRVYSTNHRMNGIVRTTYSRNLKITFSHCETFSLCNVFFFFRVLCLYATMWVMTDLSHFNEQNPSPA